MVDNIRMPTGVGPITSPRPVKPVRQQDKDNRDRSFEDQLKQQDTDNASENEDSTDKKASKKEDPQDREPQDTASDSKNKPEGEAGHIIDVHA